MFYSDAHTHLNNKILYPSREKHIQDFYEKWWRLLINIGVNESYNTKGIEIAENISKKQSNYPDLIVKSTIGIHPCEIADGTITLENRQDEYSRLRQLYESHKQHIVAIGECGIDLHYPDTEKTVPLQQQVFRDQCLMARTHHLPLVIHSRDARDQTREVVEEFKDLCLYFHCRSYERWQTEYINKHLPDYYIGFCANISYPKATNIRESLSWLLYHHNHYPDRFIDAKKIQITASIDPTWTQFMRQHMIDRIGYDSWSNFVLETDAPYLAPQARRWDINTPAMIVEHYDYISHITHIDKWLLCERMMANTKRLYRIPPWKGA